MKKKRIALFGGSFNPPHNGHSSVVKALDSLAFIDEVWLMPSANRWDKKISVSGPDRLRMIDLMIDDLHLDAKKPVRAFDHEVRKPNLSTTFETKAELEALYPYHEFHFVFGSDVVPDIRTKWIYGKELFDSAHFIFVERPGSVRLADCSLPVHCVILPSDAHTGEQLSSTIVRAESGDESALRRLVSPSVADFIAKKGFYAKTGPAAETKEKPLAFAKGS